MNWEKLFRLFSKKEQAYEFANVLHLWDEDYLMIELVPKENLEFIKKEIIRTLIAGENNIQPSGFKEATVIGSRPVQTADRNLLKEEVGKCFEQSGFARIDQYIMEKVGLMKGDKIPLGFGTATLGVILEGSTNVLNDIWIAGRTDGKQDENRLIQGLLAFGKQYNFIGVNWFRGEYFNLANLAEVENFAAHI